MSNVQLTTGSSKHDIAIGLSIFVKSRHEQSYIDGDEDRNKCNVDVIILHVWFR